MYLNLRNEFQMTTCIICAEQVNKSNHILVVCPYCEYEACRSCCETYLLGQPQAKCMLPSCGKEWSRQFLVKSFTKSFISKDWKNHREAVLFERELALLPATQNVVEDMIRREKAIEEMEKIKIHIKQLHNQMVNLGHQSRTSSVKHSRFVRACPDSDCRGYLSIQWKCGLCESFACADCHVIIGKQSDVPHTCNPDELATAKLLTKDTKQCPCCRSSIFKITGCDQMWCTQCRTAFSWRTGEIETRIHNPHFYEWQRHANGREFIDRNVGDVVCGRELTHGFLNEIGLRERLKPKILPSPMRSDDPKLTISSKLFDDALTIVRCVIHMNQVHMPAYHVDQVENNQALRISYMRQEIDKETFQRKIQKSNKLYDKKKEMSNILHLFVQATTDIMFRFRELIRTFVFDTVSLEQLAIARAILDEVKAIEIYSNEHLSTISSTYNSKQKEIKVILDNGVKWEDVLVNVV